jgi:polar amino acid transport system substrate-binding protein
MAAVLVVGLLFAVGCAGEKKAEEKAEAPAAEAPAETPAAPAEEAAPEIKTVVFATDASWPPMEFVDKDKNIVGFDIDLLNAMGAAGGFTPEFKNTAWDGIFGGLIAGKYDAISSSVSITEERMKTMDFSDPYFEVKQGVIVQTGSGIATAADLAGKVVAAQIGTTGYFAAQKLEGIAEAKSYDDVGLAVEDLYNGRVDAVLCDDAVAYDYALQNEKYADKLELAFVVETETKEYLGFAVQKGNQELVDLLNAALAKVKESGEYDQIMDKWF